MIHLRVDRIFGCPWWYLRRCIAWRVDDFGEMRCGPRRLTLAGAERAYHRRTDTAA